MKKILFTLATFVVLGSPAWAAERPNILFLFTDDQAPWAIGVSGYPHAKTPNLDRLAKSGAYLVNSFTTTPVCSPSRASLMTSRYGSELGITDWIHPRREPQLGLDPDLVTWPEVLREAGYHTGLVGKWHLGVPDRFHPTKTGFDYFMGFRTGGTRPSNPILEKNGQPQRFGGLTADILTDHAVEFLRQKRTSPFLLCVHYRAPHSPWLPVAPEDWEPFKKLNPKIPNPDYPNLNVRRVKRMTREYLASMHSVDRNLGRIFRELDVQKLTKNTIVIFSSDHGYNMGHNGIWHKGNGHWVLKKPPKATKNIPRNQRPNMYDHSLRVPTIVRWPGRVKAGTVIRNTVSNLDWFPTILAMANVKMPKQTIRGRNIVPLLDGKKVDWNDDFYAEYSTHHQSRTHMRMVRTKKWKLIRDYLNPNRHELFDLQKDPAESTNLFRARSAQTQAVVRDLTKQIEARMRLIGDKVLTAKSSQSAGR